MATKRSRLRFELGRLEVAGVVVSTAAGLFVVFLLGIYAGRGMAERRLEFDDQIVRVPVDVDESAARDTDDELQFYEALAKDDVGALPEDEPEAVDRLNEIVSGAVLEEENLPERVEAPPEPKIAQATERVVSPPAAAPPPAEPEARVAIALVDEAPAADTPPPATGGEWSVQVAATRDPRHAESIKRQLTTAGYRTYIVKTVREGETYHRVRVGHYPSLDQARQVASLLRRQPGVTGAFVASD